MLTYGSKKEFKTQLHLGESGYSDFDDWKEKRYFSLNHNIFYIGRIDKKNCNQVVQLTAQEDGRFSLKLLLGLAFREKCKTKFILVKGIRIRNYASLLRYYLSSNQRARKAANKLPLLQEREREMVSSDHF